MVPLRPCLWPLCPQRETGLGDRGERPPLSSLAGGWSGEKGGWREWVKPRPWVGVTVRLQVTQPAVELGPVTGATFRDWRDQCAPGDLRGPGCLVAL